MRFVFRIKDFDARARLPALFLESHPGEELNVASGIRDKVAIVGMGCSRFGERWDCGADDLMVEAFTEAVGRRRHRARPDRGGLARRLLPGAERGKSGLPLSMALRLPNVPVTRVENLCATGTEALRGAVYAVAAGAVDIALAMGVEKLKDTGFAGLPERTKGTFEDLWQPGFTPPGAFAQLGAAYAARHGHSMDDVKRAMAHVSWKSHENAVAKPEGAPAQPHHDRAGARRADDRLPARSLRLLRRQRRRRLRDRHDARDRGVARQARHGDGQGTGARAVERRRDGSRELGWQPHADHAACRRSARIREAGITQADASR